MDWSFVSRIVLLIIIGNIGYGNGLVRRCFSCRSRGDLGTCRDPFTYNATSIDVTHGVEAVPCASGWCGKFLEGGTSFKDDDYGIATQRLCLQRGPSDSEERCAYTKWNHKEVFMCFCLGDLCNSSSRLSNPLLGIVSALLLTFMRGG
ncbi:uncharacterized protein LOC124163104 [Ischnura elegans]|uniref:uncharacterized protein LOC124162666 n=1 Tax=Ischnura elegans TaxID=197161 RepID=UPI001ED8924F|nr:uncharacterized protein LOC124162666 [Ischnura elegans]XP_046395861.1 uncharacterized protein LOC124163104 [Ischnura elegans]